MSPHDTLRARHECGRAIIKDLIAQLEQLDGGRHAEAGREEPVWSRHQIATFRTTCEP